jgi:preprotein translocase subunit YajC
MSSKTFTKWTEEERRAHRRTQNAAYQARKVEYLTPRQKQIKEEERKKRQETKQAMEQGEWVATMTGVKTSIKVEKKEKVVAKNGFAALDSDSEEEIVQAKEQVWGKQKIDWAADSDDE